MIGDSYSIGNSIFTYPSDSWSFSLKLYSLSLASRKTLIYHTILYTLTQCRYQSSRESQQNKQTTKAAGLYWLIWLFDPKVKNHNSPIQAPKCSGCPSAQCAMAQIRWNLGGHPTLRPSPYTMHRRSSPLHCPQSAYSSALNQECFPSQYPFIHCAYCGLVLWLDRAEMLPHWCCTDSVPLQSKTSLSGTSIDFCAHMKYRVVTQRTGQFHFHSDRFMYLAFILLWKGKRK